MTTIEGKIANDSELKIKVTKEIVLAIVVTANNKIEFHCYLLNLILLMEKYKKSLNENNYYDVLK
jgi:hypothetical protein